jgi:starch phosphorylase
VSLIEEGPVKHVRMANLAIVGSHSTNGVAAIHSRLLRTTTVKDLAEVFPERFNNKTNGVTPPRWLLLANQPLARVITEAIGDGWITDLSELSKLKALAGDPAFAMASKSQARGQISVCRLAEIAIRRDRGSGLHLRLPDQTHPRIQTATAQRAARHGALQPAAENPKIEMAPRTFFFAGKAAPAYQLAKLIIKFIENLAGTIDGDPATRGRLKVLFLPEYDVTLAERLIPASDVSNQISTAGYEASGTSNMKFMMNGALTIGTRDGATIEMAQEAGEENFFLFGLTAEQVAEQPRVVQSALALRSRAGNARGAWI